uniref:Uncharacterized protein n=1 Tax=Siphoviridae sp. ctxdc10 TaxID=2825740 RepID=A0A8S5TSK8_9CAUD|nr:MAG TPA: hypothetical protein [Siphoviridae sp. ctxdc10]
MFSVHSVPTGWLFGDNRGHVLLFFKRINLC